MLKWELKKIIKEKTNIIALVLLVVLFLQMSFIKPMLETESEYYDETKNEYFVDKRDKNVIANENLKSKVDGINTLAQSISIDKQSKKMSEISQEKLKLDEGSNYEDITFYEVFSDRIDFALPMIIMVIIIILICSNLYTEEQISNVAPIILSSKNKEKALYSKLIIAILLPIILYGVYVLGTLVVTYIQYGKPLNGNLQAYRISELAVLLKVITINKFIMAKIITSLLMLTAISLVSLLSSFISDNSIKSIGLSVGFIAIGKILTMFKFLPAKLLSLIGIGNYVDVMMGSSKISGFYNGHVEIFSKSFDISNLCLSMYGIIVIVFIIGNIYCIKKVLTK